MRARARPTARTHMHMVTQRNNIKPNRGGIKVCTRTAYIHIFAIARSLRRTRSALCGNRAMGAGEVSGERTPKAIIPPHHLSAQLIYQTAITIGDTNCVRYFWCASRHRNRRINLSRMHPRSIGSIIANIGNEATKIAAARNRKETAR